MHRVIAAVLLGLLVSACQPGYRATSPESLYTQNADAALALQIPPDLTDVSEGEQFVLPGNSGGAITRNTLLPNLDAIKFVRSGAENWLELKHSPEDVWPQLQAFLRSERFPISQTEPVAGVMSSQWRALTDAEGRSALKSLLGSDDSVTRVAFRLERDSAANATRLFARQQVAKAADVEISPDALWPPNSHDPENTSELLVRLMVFLGVEEQKARGILSDDAVSSVFDNATLETTATNTWLVVHRGYRPAFRAVSAALRQLGDEADIQVDDNVGRVEALLRGSRVAFRVTPVNVSAARVSVIPVSTESTKPLTQAEQKALLNDLRELLV